MLPNQNFTSIPVAFLINHAENEQKRTPYLVQPEPKP
jgi:hypothetical protein